MRFFKNLADNWHCFHASLLMALSYFFPKEKYTYKDMECFTDFKNNTWNLRGLNWLTKKGLKVTWISDFDYPRFAKEGERYLKWFWRPEVYTYQAKVSNFQGAQKEAKALQGKVSFATRKPLLSDIDTYF